LQQRILENATYGPRAARPENGVLDTCTGGGPVWFRAISPAVRRADRLGVNRIESTRVCVGTDADPPETPTRPHRLEVEMSPDRDLVLLETVRTHRARLLAAFLHGELESRRPANDNLRRFAVGFVVAAFACVGCIAYSLVSAFVAQRAASGR
jgi:hypothetical protein